MPFSVLITLTTTGGNTGPNFDLYSDSDSYANPFETDVLKTDLVTGYTATDVPNGTTIIRCKSKGTCTNYVDLSINGLPNTTPTPTPTLTPTPTPIYTTIYFSSGTSMNNACTGVTTQAYFYQGSLVNGTVLYTDNTLINVAPGTNSAPRYYYYSDTNTLYRINDSEGHLYNDGTIVCPTPTPVLNTIVVSLDLTDGATACNGGGQYYPINVDCYGSNISNATALLNLPNAVLADFSTNQVFYVSQRVSGVFVWRTFQMNGAPSPSTTASPLNSSQTCPA